MKCECKGCKVVNHGPAAFIVERMGTFIPVCTKCDVSTDRYVSRLFQVSNLNAWREDGLFIFAALFGHYDDIPFHDERPN